MYCSKPDPSRKRGFTLLEVATALVILGTICSSVLVVMSRALSATIDLRKRMQAFEIARENMETLLARVNVSDMTDFGVHPLYSDVEWETTIEPFYEPITNKLWIQAVCTATYVDSHEEKQTLTLTHWLTGLSERQAKQILDQQEREKEYLDLLNANDETIKEQLAIREYLKQKGLDVKEYDRLLAEQKRQKRQWINEYEYDPDLFSELADQLRQPEYQWLDGRGFNQEDFDLWKNQQGPKFWENINIMVSRSGGFRSVSGNTSSSASSGNNTSMGSDSTSDSSNSNTNSGQNNSSTGSDDFERPADFDKWNPEQQKLWEDLIKRLGR